MTTTLLKAIDMIDVILEASEDSAVFSSPPNTAPNQEPAKGHHGGNAKQGKKAAKTKKTKNESAPVASDLATQDPMASADLRVANIVSVEAVENSDKLWKCQVNVGEDQPRQIVAGLQPYISKEVMQGLSVVIICNLKAAKLAGQMSEAMILAATSAEDSSIVRTLQPPEGSRPGDKVSAADIAGEPAKTLKSKLWMAIVEKLRTAEGRPAYDGQPLVTQLGPCSVAADIPDGSTIR